MLIVCAHGVPTTQDCSHCLALDQATTASARIIMTADDLAEALNKARDEGRAAALSEVHDVFATVDDLPMGSTRADPEPLVKIVWREVPGNPGAGVPSMAGWVLAPRQGGTRLFEWVDETGRFIDSTRRLLRSLLPAEHQAASGPPPTHS